MREVEAQAVSLHEGAFLRDVFAEHLAQGGVHEVGGRVVGHHGLAAHSIDMQRGLRAHSGGAGHELTNMDVHVAGTLLHVAHDEAGAILEDDFAMVACLAAGFGVERRRVEDEFRRAGRQRVCQHAARRDGDQLAVAFSVAIAGEVRGAHLVADAEPDFIRCLIAGGKACGAAAFTLHFHGGIEAIDIHRHTAGAQDVLRQVQREAIGIVELEGRLTRQGVAFLQRLGFLLKQRQAVAERPLEAGFFLLQRCSIAALARPSSG